MKHKKAVLVRGFKTCLILSAVVISVLIVRDALIVEENIQYRAYCEDMIRQAGLTEYKSFFTIEHFFCEDSLIDAKVFLKIKVDEEHKDEIVNKMKGFQRFLSELVLLPTPAWWKPVRSTERIAYYIDKESASPVVIAYIDTCNGETHLYVAIIPV